MRAEEEEQLAGQVNNRINSVALDALAQNYWFPLWSCGGNAEDRWLRLART